MKKILFLASVLFIFFTFFHISYADSGALSGATGGSLKAYNDTNIEMVNETITMDVKGAGDETGKDPGAHVQVDYAFHNTTNEPVTVLTGFPERDESNPLYHFSAFVGGKKMNVTKQKGQQQQDENGNSYTEYWYTYNMSFTPGQTLLVRNTYDQDAIGGEGSKGYFASYSYIVDTGATWKGNIQTINYIVHLKNDSIYSTNSLSPVYPGNLWKISDGGQTLQLSVKNIKPGKQDNFSLAVGNKYGSTRVQDGCNERISDPAQADNPDVAKATSVKKQDSSGTYFACQALDEPSGNGWASADGELPIGQTLYHTPYFFQFNRVFDSVFIRGGMQVAGNTDSNILPIEYTDYSRPKIINLTFSSPTDTLYSVILNIPDNASGTIVSLPDHLLFQSQGSFPQLTESIKIMDIYPGKKYNNVAISEFGLYSYPANTFVETQSPKTITVIGQKEDQALQKEDGKIAFSSSALSTSVPSNRKKQWWYVFAGIVCLVLLTVIWKVKNAKKE